MTISPAKMTRPNNVILSIHNPAPTPRPMIALDETHGTLTTDDTREPAPCAPPCLRCGAPLAAGRHLYCAPECAIEAHAGDEQHSRPYVGWDEKRLQTKLTREVRAVNVVDFRRYAPTLFADSFMEQYS